MTPRANTIWIREYDDGDWEIGLLEDDTFFGRVMCVDGDHFDLSFDLADWQYVCDL